MRPLRSLRSKISFFAIEVIGLSSFHDDFFPRIFGYCPLATVRIITGITRRAAAARIVSDHIINKIVIPLIPKLVRFPWLKEKCVPGSHFSVPLLVAHYAPAGNHQVKLRFSGVGMIGTKEFAFRNPDQRDIEWMSPR